VSAIQAPLMFASPDCGAP